MKCMIETSSLLVLKKSINRIRLKLHKIYADFEINVSPSQLKSRLKGKWLCYKYTHSLTHSAHSLTIRPRVQNSLCAPTCFSHFRYKRRWHIIQRAHTHTQTYTLTHSFERAIQVHTLQIKHDVARFWIVLRAHNNDALQIIAYGTHLSPSIIIGIIFFGLKNAQKKSCCWSFVSVKKRKKIRLFLELFFFCVRFFWFYSLEKSLKVIIMQSIHNTCTMRHVFQTFKSFFFVRSFVVDS